MTTNDLSNLTLTLVPSTVTSDAAVGDTVGQLIATYSSTTVLTLDEVKRNLRVYHTDDDDLITGLTEAAEDYLNRVGVVVSSPVVPTARQAALMLIGHWYNNREAVSDVAKIKVPLALDMLISSLRIAPL